MRRLPARLCWAGAALVVWPAYYAWLLIRWVVGPLGLLRGWEAVRREDADLHRRLLNPPFVDRLRG